VAGSGVLLRHSTDTYSAYCHLEPGIDLRVGRQIAVETPLGCCENSENSVKPHPHFQLQIPLHPFSARDLPARFGDLGWHYGQLTAYVANHKKVPPPTRLLLHEMRSEDLAISDAYRNPRDRHLAQRAVDRRTCHTDD